jgi:hypothetical protein
MSTNDESDPPLVNPSNILTPAEVLNARNGVYDEVAAENQDAGRVGAAAIAYANEQVPGRLPVAIEHAEAQKLAKIQANEQEPSGTDRENGGSDRTQDPPEPSQGNTSN